MKPGKVQSVPAPSSKSVHHHRTWTTIRLRTEPMVGQYSFTRWRFCSIRPSPVRSCVMPSRG
ncbi:MAG TPA: hypothetical protein VKB80_29640 [Kofleriaceae bacterium]|nr:hypothetical protein [Kofleriaceae bacterium]